MNIPVADSNLQLAQQEFYQEIDAIAAWWMTHAQDPLYGGVYGKIDNDNKVVETAAKGAVLHSRVLWTFSAFYRTTGNMAYRQMAQKAYVFITTHLMDDSHGGLYWTVSRKGEPLHTKKQVYAIAFGIYALSQYHLATEDAKALEQAIAMFQLIESKALDGVHGGYFEAFDRQWQPLADMRLSEKDSNMAKTMNTHLHLLEAYSELYVCWPQPQLAAAIGNLLALFFRYFIDPDTHHLHLFFNDRWQKAGSLISFGHDVEAAWLLQEAAGRIGHIGWQQKTSDNAVAIASAAAKGLDSDGGLWYEQDAVSGLMVKEKHWWPQAEAMVGFYNAYQITGNNNWLVRATRSWDYIKQNMRNMQHGEWYWGRDADGAIMQGQDKAGLWKCPYHNGRACLQLLSRINTTHASSK